MARSHKIRNNVFLRKARQLFSSQVSEMVFQAVTCELPVIGSLWGFLEGFNEFHGKMTGNQSSRTAFGGIKEN